MNKVERTNLVRAIHQTALDGGTMIEQVPDLPEGAPLAREWKTFKREVYRLVFAGQAGWFALLKGDELCGVFDTQRQAQQAGEQRFGQEPFLVQEVQLSIPGLPGSPPPQKLPSLCDQEPPTIHYTELPPPPPGSPLEVEGNTYRREVGRLLAEGHEGRHVLIKGDQILGIWDTNEEALEEGYRRFLLQPFLVQQIQTRERLWRMGMRPCLI
jgi:hypothetical protein